MREEDLLDATCGGRSIWTKGNKEREDTLYIDKRKEEPGFAGQDNRSYEVNPDEIEDFTDLPYEEEQFNLVVFDPPHLIKDGGMKSASSYIEKNYGVLNSSEWKETLRKGFIELWKVLKPGGTLVFKFADNDAYWTDVFEQFPQDPLFGTTTKQRSNMETRWFVFYKEEK